MEQAGNISDLEQALYQLCLEMAKVWQEPRLLGSSSTSTPKIVVTRTDEGGPILPRTKRPIRGRDNVVVDVREGKLQGAELAKYWTRQALLDPWGYRSDDPEIVKGRAPINAKVKDVFSIFKKTSRLPERLFEALGFKHYEPDEVRLLAQESAETDDRTPLWTLQLASSIGRALASMGFDPTKREEFKEWEKVANLVTQDFKDLAARQRNRYKVVICLNSPLMDQEGPLPIAYFNVAEEPIEVCLSGVTDEILTKLLKHTSGFPVDQVNTAISFGFTVDVDAPVEKYLDWYSSAVFLAERVTDLLRLICTDDVGVLALEIFEPDWATPTIRKTYENSYRLDLAPYQPKRFRFGPATEQILSESQIAQIIRLAPSYVTGEINAKGLETAMRRFRASFDRYQPSDPERLLEIAIAFEAILLNDSGDNHQELGYRLRLRAARFLTEDLEERLRIFDLLRDLYNFRSRIAHGETLEGMKSKDQTKLEAVIKEAPEILKKLLLKVMEATELRGLKEEQLIAWWRKVELR